MEVATYILNPDNILNLPKSTQSSPIHLDHHIAAVLQPIILNLWQPGGVTTLNN
jgi:hypothetical protein